ncbi:hypothetical protein [Nostoc sphaeroides]|uniref:Uncharacterized protein n=1 Tax=Nostoc sphaeroides CCNUC1 TaxID=2653204 RepID=A0A5P8WFC2_9NOSO|nr:hypothetical protein [Nostoc sphaeroides]MCC5633070.1 hypothetical protein [Nostoc sphaeroides CHAB 2801]QFS51525.1 hypothetical protein GXM_09019 [Nostoc sphaeroides CCNUC1]
MSSIRPIHAQQNVVNLDSLDDIELQQYFLLFIQQRDIQVSSSCQVLWQNYCQILKLEWTQRENTLENYMNERGVEVPEHEELSD